MSSLRNVNVTERQCAVCQGPLPAGRARQWCSDACRQAAYRNRHTPAVTAPVIPAKTPRRPHTIYQCPNCDARTLGSQRCDECNIFMTRIGYGGTCPCCDEPITFDELLGNKNLDTAKIVRPPEYTQTTT